MRRDRYFFVMERSRNDPETDSALPHRVLLSPYPNLHTNARMPARTSRWETGVSQRNEYGSVVCVSSVASLRFSSRCCVSLVFGGDHRISRPGFCKISSRYGTVCSRALPWALRRSSHRQALRISSLSAHRTRIALGARSSGNKAAGLCRRRCQPVAQRGLWRYGNVQRRRRGAPLPWRQSHRPRQPLVRTLHEPGFAAYRL